MKAWRTDDGRVAMARGGWSMTCPIDALTAWRRFYIRLARRGPRQRSIYLPDVVALGRLARSLQAPHPDLREDREDERRAWEDDLFGGTGAA